ncbi:MAG: DUF4956 domain-containing protein [Acidobacteriota bacterium]
MNQLLEFLNPATGEELFHPLDIVVVVAIVMVCLFVVTRSYQSTHRGVTYTQSFIHALFLMGLCTGIVMMIIGSNIARAFSLVGALSIIRFRTAVKDVRDTAYLFFAVVVGMGAGTGFYLHTVVFTLVASAVMWGLFRFDYAAKSETEEVLKVTFDRGSSAPEAIAEYLDGHFDEARLINSIRHFDSDQDTLVYVVRGPVGSDFDAAAEGLEGVEHVTAAQLYVNDQQVTL